MDIEKRFIELESKLAFQEDTLMKLNDALYEQQKEIFKLKSKLSALEDDKNTDGDFSRLYMNEKPPHY